MSTKLEFLRYKNTGFTARFPKHYLYSKSHYWLMALEEDRSEYRIGFTKFATRMLGELIDCQFEMKKGDEVIPGQNIGWVEGFKAASDIYSVFQGNFSCMNPYLKKDTCVIYNSPYLDGFLYQANGKPEGSVMDVNGYTAYLDEVIGEMKEKEEYAEYE